MYNYINMFMYLSVLGVFHMLWCDGGFVIFPKNLCKGLVLWLVMVVSEFLAAFSISCFGFVYPVPFHWGWVALFGLHMFMLL